MERDLCRKRVAYILGIVHRSRKSFRLFLFFRTFFCEGLLGLSLKSLDLASSIRVCFHSTKLCKLLLQLLGKGELSWFKLCFLFFKVREKALLIIFGLFNSIVCELRFDCVSVTLLIGLSLLAFFFLELQLLLLELLHLTLPHLLQFLLIFLSFCFQFLLLPLLFRFDF